MNAVAYPGGGAGGAAPPPIGSERREIFLDLGRFLAHFSPDSAIFEKFRPSAIDLIVSTF